MSKSASIDAEKSMITKVSLSFQYIPQLPPIYFIFITGQVNYCDTLLQLKTECGSQFTNKLEGMFKVRISFGFISSMANVFTTRISVC